MAKRNHKPSDDLTSGTCARINDEMELWTEWHSHHPRESNVNAEVQKLFSWFVMSRNAILFRGSAVDGVNSDAGSHEFWPNWQN
jgi:hypothetical protein